MRARFGVDTDDIGSRLAEGFQIGVRRRDHQVDIERDFDMRTQGFDDIWAKRDVRHKMAVHDVNMQPIGACGLDGARLFAKLSKIRGQQRRSDDGTDLCHG